MNKTTRINAQNVYTFLSEYAKEISVEDLKPLVLDGGGGNLLFLYRDNGILKIPRTNRTKVLKEAKLLEYLNKQSLPVTIPKPLMVHDEGFYALFSRIDGISFGEEDKEELAIERLKSTVEPLGAFLTFLHHHEFPPYILEYIPCAEDSLKSAFDLANQRLKTIVDQTSAVETKRPSPRFYLSIDQLRMKLDRLKDSLGQKWAVTHSDLSLNHLFSVQGGATPLAVIDFADSFVNDPSVDFAALASELREDLPTDGLLVERILGMILDHYQTDDEFIIDKIEFWFLTFEIASMYNRLENRDG